MVTTSGPKRKQKKPLPIREYRKQLAILKKSGLVSSRIDARSHKPTRYMREQLERFKDVVAGTAKAIKAPSREEAREYEDIRPVKGVRIVVRVSPGDKPRYDRLSRSLRIERKSHYEGIEKFTQIIVPQAPDEVPILPRDTWDKVYRYGMPFRHGRTIRRIFADSIEEILTFMSTYDPSKGGTFEGWQSYIEILEFDRGDMAEDEFDIEADFGDEDEGEAAFARRRAAKAMPRDEKGRFIKVGGSSPSKKTRRKKAR